MRSTESEYTIADNTIIITDSQSSQNPVAPIVVSKLNVNLYSTSLQLMSKAYTNEMSHTYLYSSAAEQHHSLAGTQFPIPLRVGGWGGLAAD